LKSDRKEQNNSQGTGEGGGHCQEIRRKASPSLLSKPISFMSYTLPKDYRAVNLRRKLYEMKPSHANAKFRSAQSRTLMCAGIGTPLRFVGWDAERAYPQQCKSIVLQKKFC